MEETVSSQPPGTGDLQGHPPGRVARTWHRLSEGALRRRARMTRTPHGRVLWRLGVAVVGGLVLIVGIIAIPGPGQGWAIVFIGLAILSTEFRWAKRLRDRAWRVFVRNRDRYSASSPRVRAAVVAVVAVVCALTFAVIAWLTLVVGGVPGWLPEAVAGPLRRLVPGVD